MPVGGWYVDQSELTEFTEALRETAGDIKDLTKVYREIGKKAGQYVKYHEPIYGGPDKGRHNTVHLQDRTKGGGGKGGAYASITKVDYLYVQEFGGTSFWHKSGAGSLRKSNRAHKSYAQMGAKGHVIYKKPRRSLGYFIWNVAFRMRTYIGETLCGGLVDIAAKHDIDMDIAESYLDIEQKSKP
jgi:hypothetical protein